MREAEGSETKGTRDEDDSLKARPLRRVAQRGKGEADGAWTRARARCAEGPGASGGGVVWLTYLHA